MESDRVLHGPNLIGVEVDGGTPNATTSRNFPESMFRYMVPHPSDVPAPNIPAAPAPLRTEMPL